MNMTLQTEGRTWFGTLTLRPEVQDLMLDRAKLNAAEPNAVWWDEPHCDARFAAVRGEILKEVQRFWKRLRKAGHIFKYVLVFERHKTGLPHMHFLLHEQDKPITKRAIQAAWALGHSNVSIVGGQSAKAAAPTRAAWYVVKYLTKSEQSRVISSLGYKPLKRTERAIIPEGDVKVASTAAKRGAQSARVRARDDLRRACACATNGATTAAEVSVNEQEGVL